jgi:hypothetical protein
MDPASVGVPRLPELSRDVTGQRRAERALGTMTMMEKMQTRNNFRDLTIIRSFF